MKLWDKIKSWFKNDDEYLVTVQKVSGSDVKAAIEEDEKKRGELGIMYASIPGKVVINPEPKDNLVEYYDRILNKMTELKVENPLIESRGVEVVIDNSDKVLFASSKETIMKYDVIEVSHAGSGRKEFVCRLVAKFPRMFSDPKIYCAVTMTVEISVEGFFQGMNGAGERITMLRNEIFDIALDILRKSSVADDTGFVVSLPKDVHNKNIDELGWRSTLPVNVTEYTYTNRNPQLDVLTGRDTGSNKFMLLDILRIGRLVPKKGSTNFEYSKK